jgi:hypothetical protein
MARIEGKKPEEESLAIPPIRISFPKATYVMQPDKGHGNLLQKLSSMNINTLEEDQVEDIAEKIESGRRDEELPQLSHRQDFHSKASRRREVPELGDPRSFIGF